MASQKEKDGGGSRSRKEQDQVSHTLFHPLSVLLELDCRLRIRLDDLFGTPAG
jgi:hypothetical protein